jgi:CDP-diglyceride synthetase
MGKGLLIMIIVFIVVALLHIISQKMTRISEKKKIKFRKIFWYFYGILFITQGIVRMVEKERFNILSVLFIILGLFWIVLNYLDKINPKTTQK